MAITTSEKIKFILKRLDLTQKEVTDKLGTSQSNLSQKLKANDWRESDINNLCRVIGIDYEINFKLDDGTII